MSKVFLDTNILIYALAHDSGEKSESCRVALANVRRQHEGVISTQVLQEFYVTATQKIKVKPTLAREMLSRLENFEVITLSPDLIREAIDCQQLSKISFWDALIVVAAESAHCETLYTEDLNHGQKIRGVRVENPFKDC